MKHVKDFSNFINEDEAPGKLLSLVNDFMKGFGVKRSGGSDKKGKTFADIYSGDSSSQELSKEDLELLPAAIADVVKDNSGVIETPKGSNRGPKIEAYLKSTGLGGGHPWCMAFVYYFFDQVFKKIGKSNPLPKTPGVKDFWNKVPGTNKIDISQARANPEMVKPGMIAIMTRKEGGHTGVVVSIDPDSGEMYILEGNNNDSVVNQKRKLSDGNLTGFVDYLKNSRDEDFDKQVLYAMTAGQNQRTAKVSTNISQKLV